MALSIHSAMAEQEKAPLIRSHEYLVMVLVVYCREHS
jgi:hypothetical protein